MINSAFYTVNENLDYRPADIVMDLNRLGSLYPYPLSFMRSLIRRILREQWDIRRSDIDLDKDGYGHVIYEITTPLGFYSYVVFSKYLDPNVRSDRVIAEDWDMTVTLCEGKVDTKRLERLRENVPLQENGRVDTSCFVLSRANKSARNFNYVIKQLASGHQPDLDVMAKVGYLYRTTAVYGSGKFGMADWEQVRTHYPDFARPFAAEMFSCFLIRDFSLFQADYVARQRMPHTAVTMDEDIKRYVGIGNATGLGMAPYLINHPLLINNWIEIREMALARIKKEGAVTTQKQDDFRRLAMKAMQHLAEISTDNIEQNSINLKTSVDLGLILDWADSQSDLKKWTQLTIYAEEYFGHEVQELLNAILLELFPDLVNDLEDHLSVEERYDLVPEMLVSDFKLIVNDQYQWALDIDFSQGECLGTFWYRSEEKQEPRLGERFWESGADKEMLLGIAHCVRRCYDDLKNFDETASIAWFVTNHPQHRYIIRRIQTMAQTRYGEIRVNLLDENILPIHLLRCKLSFFGVGKFDPRSRFWVRNTMFQGAPLLTDIGTLQNDTWCFPIKPPYVSVS